MFGRAGLSGFRISVFPIKPPSGRHQQAELFLPACFSPLSFLPSRLDSCVGDLRPFSSWQTGPFQQSH